MNGTFAVPSTRTLTVGAGTVIKFYDTSSHLLVSGALDVNGTSTEPVYFTSYKDDSVAGDTNNNGSGNVAGIGNWGKVQFNSGSVGDLRYAVISYGGYNASAGSRYMLYNNGGTVDIEYSVLSQSHAQALNQTAGSLTINGAGFLIQDQGINVSGGTASVEAGVFIANAVGFDVTGGTVAVTDSYFNGNTSYAIEASVPVDADDNYWGADDGPYPGGSGDAITNDVDASSPKNHPWLILGGHSVDNGTRTLEWTGSTSYMTEWNAAVSSWNALSPVNISEAESTPDLTVEDINDGITGECATYHSGDNKVRFSLGDMEGNGCLSYQASVAIHELGHALGLGHSFVDTVMASNAGDISDNLTEMDIFMYHLQWGF